MGGLCSSNSSTQSHKRVLPGEFGLYDKNPNNYKVSTLSLHEQTIISTENILDFYKINLNILGHGHFGLVRLCMSTATLKYYAVKTLEKKMIAKHHNQFLKEIGIIKSLDHPFIVKFYEAYQDLNHFHLVMEYLSGGELMQKIQEKGYLSEDYASFLFYRILVAVNYVHGNGIVHRDLKPENFLFKNKTADSELKLVDFGLSKNQDEESLKSMQTVAGTALYIAPEVLKGIYNEKCDYWSLGVILYFMLSGNTPFFASSKSHLFKRILRGKFSFSGPEWKRVSKPAKDLIIRLIHVNIHSRNSAKQALNHPWIQHFNKEKKTKFSINILNNMKNFVCVSYFKREVIKYIVNNLEESDIQPLKDLFYAIDKDKSGTISYQELEEGLREYRLLKSEKDLENVLSLFSDKDESISYTEFIASTIDPKHIQNKDTLKRVFTHFDVDHSNSLTPENIKSYFARVGKSISNEELELIIAEIDTDMNGSISFDEFYDMMVKENPEVVVERRKSFIMSDRRNSRQIQPLDFLTDSSSHKGRERGKSTNLNTPSTKKDFLSIKTGIN